MRRVKAQSASVFVTAAPACSDPPRWHYPPPHLRLAALPEVLEACLYQQDQRSRPRFLQQMNPSPSHSLGPLVLPVAPRRWRLPRGVKASPRRRQHLLRRRVSYTLMLHHCRTSAGGPACMQCGSRTINREPQPASRDQGQEPSRSGYAAATGERWLRSTKRSVAGTRRHARGTSLRRYAGSASRPTYHCRSAAASGRRKAGSGRSGAARGGQHADRRKRVE